ncbi:hypothetical protein SDC9_112264 [bioreactor metagenome]|uniref:Uncharacterized protein n=1 Tax=bioreactor metagenome TaxID=1076179 RepID=A0A645BIT2_9ZZZZ
MGEYRHGFALVLLPDVPQGSQHPVPNGRHGLSAPHVPQVGPGGEQAQLLRLLNADLAPGLFLPLTHADLPQVFPLLNGQVLRVGNGPGGNTGAGQIAGIHRVDLLIPEALRQSGNLLIPPVRDDAVTLALGNAVQVPLRLSVADQIQGGHGKSSFPSFFYLCFII